MGRLQTIASLVPKGSIVADIGTDHAQLPLLLRERHISPLIYAIDNKPGPLRQAYQNTQGVKGITLVLANGIEQLSSDVTTLVLAGLGGRTIVDILATIPTHIDTIVVSANVAMPLVREALVQQGFAIDAEDLVEEAAELYEIARFIRGIADYNQADLICGPLLRRDKPALWDKWLDLKLKETEYLLSQIPSGDPKRQEVEALYQLFQEQ
jgi:tRNA (adenine22-N1)-methyltransferase